MRILRGRGGKALWSAGRKWPAGPRRYRERSACQPDTNSGGTTDSFVRPEPIQPAHDEFYSLKPSQALARQIPLFAAYAASFPGRGKAIGRPGHISLSAEGLSLRKSDSLASVDSRAMPCPKNLALSSRFDLSDTPVAPPLGELASGCETERAKFYSETDKIRPGFFFRS